MNGSSRAEVRFLSCPRKIYRHYEKEKEMSETSADRIAALLMEVANGEITQSYAIAEIDKIIMAERIDAAGMAHQLTRKLYHFPVGV